MTFISPSALLMDTRRVSLPTMDLVDGNIVEGAYLLKDIDDNVRQGQLRLSVQFISRAILEETEAGKVLPRAYFPARENNRLVLYQDTDTQPMKQV